MTEPKWITRQQVEFIHEAVIEMGGGSHGLRDAALLVLRSHDRRTSTPMVKATLSSLRPAMPRLSLATMPLWMGTSEPRSMRPVISSNRTVMSCKLPRASNTLR